MVRLPLAAALAGGLVWLSAGQSTGQEKAVPPQTEKINELIAKGWESAGIKLAGGQTTPTAKATDHEFMRRAFIDLIGRIPTPEEIRDFEGDKSANKRAKLVSRLLYETKYTLRNGGQPVTVVPGLKLNKQGEINYNDAYAENFAELWTTWLLTRSNANPLYRSQLRLWLTQQFAGTTKFPEGRPWKAVVEELISATGKSNENGAVVFVLRHLGEPIVTDADRKSGTREDLPKDGKYDGVPITSRVTKLFLGIQSQCTQCHDHPFNKEYVQSDFWGVNAFFRQTDRSGTTNPRNLAPGVLPPPLSLTDVPGWNEKALVRYERRDGQMRASFPVMLKNVEQAVAGTQSSKRLVPGEIPTSMEGLTRRQILAKWVTEHDNFARAFVNRMWGHLFGRGLNKEPTVDDFSMNNEVVHPELLDYLADQFKKYNYDPKRLLEWICNSDVYQLSHVANKAYAELKYDAYFARMPLKAMSPEVLFESLFVATRAESRHANDEKAAFDKLKSDWIGKLTQNFGDDEGNEVSFNGTVVQALLMMNGRELNGELGSGVMPRPKDKSNAKPRDNVIVEVMRKHGTGNRMYDELFLMTVSRHPTPEEIVQLEQVRHGQAKAQLGSGSPGKPPAKGGGSVPVAPANDDEAFFRDVLWALLNSREFMLNH
jgi:hypothetical protein